jgi:protein-S-isoprenylcysteine O-methyltransferase Ste14
MSLIPAFELGLWNAWILVIPMLFIYFSAAKVVSDRESGKSVDFQLTKKEDLISYTILLAMFFAFVYTIFLPLQFGTIWLYSGLLVYLFGMVFIIVAILNFATSPKRKIITKGLYSVSRNPMYLGMLLMQIGLGIASSSWLYLLITAILFIVLNTILSSEERYCLCSYGDEYQKYMSITPRWIGIPKSEKTD